MEQLKEISIEEVENILKENNIKYEKLNKNWFIYFYVKNPEDVGTASILFKEAKKDFITFGSSIQLTINNQIIIKYKPKSVLSEFRKNINQLFKNLKSK
jgi:hypothetical protein